MKLPIKNFHRRHRRDQLYAVKALWTGRSLLPLRIVILSLSYCYSAIETRPCRQVRVFLVVDGDHIAEYAHTQRLVAVLLTWSPYV